MIQQFGPALWQTVSLSHLVPGPGLYLQSAIRMLVGRLLAMSTAMSQERTADPAVPCLVVETGDAQVPGGSGEIEEVEVVRDLQKTADPRRLRMSWTLRWKTTGVLRRMATRLRPLRLKMILT